MADVERVVEIGIDARKAKAGGAQVKDSFDKVTDSADKTNISVERVQNKFDLTEKASHSLKTALFGLVAGFSALLIIKQIERDMVSLELAMVNLGKVSNIEGKDLEVLTGEISAMARELPGTTVELLDTAAAAARLGVQGAENIQKFTTTIARFDAATGSIMSKDAAATYLARIINVTREGTDQVEELAGAIALLGDNIAANEAEITHYTTSVAQATAMYDIGSIKASAFGGTLAALGVRAELAGSAVGRTFRAIDESVRAGGKQLILLEQLTSRPGEEIQRLFREDPTKVVLEFLDGLGQFITVGGDATKLLEEFGLQGEQVLRVLPTLAVNSEQLAKSLDLVSDESTNINKLFDEVSRSLETLSAKKEEVRDTFASIRAMIGKPFQEDWKSFNEQLAGGIGLLFGLDKASDSTSQGLVYLGRVAGIAAIGLASIVTLDVATSLFKAARATDLLAFGMTSRLLPVMKTVLVTMTRIAAIPLTALAAFSIGEYFYDEFKVVQETAANFIKILQQGWSDVYYAFSRMVIHIKSIWFEMIDAIRKPFAEFIGDFGSGLQYIEDLTKGTVFEVSLGSSDVENFARGLANSDAVEYDKAGKLREAAAENTEALNKAELQYQTTLKNIEAEFKSRGQNSGQGFVDGVTSRMRQNSNSVIDAILSPFNSVNDRINTEIGDGAAKVLETIDNLNESAETTNDITDEITVNVQGINSLLEGTSGTVESTVSSIEQLINQLRIESDLIARGVSSEQRERSIELLTIQQELLTLTNDELDGIIDKLGQPIMSLEEMLIDDPEKLQKVLQILDYVKDQMDQLRQATEWEAFADSVGDEFGDLFNNIALGVKSVEDSFEQLLRNVSRLVFEQLVSNQVASFVSGSLTKNFSGFYANGGVFSGGRVIPFANGGIVDKPTFFPLAHGNMGVMGEKGPETIMPLHRDSSGKLGVKSSGGDRPNVVVNMKVYANDAPSFDYSRGQILRGVNSEIGRRG